jgi:hypothetical protein
VFSRGPGMVVLLLRPITAAATMSLVRSAQTHARPGRPRVRQDTAAAITMAVVQAMPHPVSAEWVRLTARHRCHITTHQRRLTIVRRRLRITVRQPRLTIAPREEGAEVGDLMAAVRPVVVDHLTAGILLQVAVAPTEDHDSSLKPLQFADRAGAAFFFVGEDASGTSQFGFSRPSSPKVGTAEAGKPWPERLPITRSFNFNVSHCRKVLTNRNVGYEDYRQC